MAYVKSKSQFTVPAEWTGGKTPTPERKAERPAKPEWQLQCEYADSRCRAVYFIGTDSWTKPEHRFEIHQLLRDPKMAVFVNGRQILQADLDYWADLHEVYIERLHDLEAFEAWVAEMRVAVKRGEYATA